MWGRLDPGLIDSERSLFAGACMLTYDLRSHLMKTVSTRRHLYAGTMLLTPDASFLVTLEPDCIAIWKPKNDDNGAYSEYADNHRPADDLHYNEHDYRYVHSTDNAAQNVCLSTIVHVLSYGRIEFKMNLWCTILIQKFLNVFIVFAAVEAYRVNVLIPRSHTSCRKLIFF